MPASATSATRKLRSLSMAIAAILDLSACVGDLNMGAFRIARKDFKAGAVRARASDAALLFPINAVPPAFPE